MGFSSACNELEFIVIVIVIIIIIIIIILILIIISDALAFADFTRYIVKLVSVNARNSWLKQRL